jgi:hypothetical protein
MKMRKLGIACVSLLLGGCFELSVDANVQSNGSLVGTLEFGVSVQMSSLIAGLSKDAAKGDLLGDCGKSESQKESIPGVRVTPPVKGARGNLVTCTAQFEIDDPVKVLMEQRERAATSNDRVRELSSVSLERLGDNAYRFAYTFQPEQKPNKDEDENRLVAAMFGAAMANHYVTLSISAERIDNATGEVAPDKKRVTWKTPITVLVNPPPGYRQELRADIVYRDDSWLGRASRLFGREETPKVVVPPPRLARDPALDRRIQLEAELLRYERDLAQAVAELAGAKKRFDMEARKRSEQQAALDKITLKNPKFQIRSGSYRDEAMISFSLENRSPVAIKKVYVEGTLQTPGRSVPWVKEQFSHEIRGGVEPGETRTFDLVPNMFSEWGKVPKEVTPGAVLALRLIAFEDPAGQRIGHSSAGDSAQRDQDHIKTLEDKVNVLLRQIEDVKKQRN